MLIWGVVKLSAKSDHLPYLCPTRRLALPTPLISSTMKRRRAELHIDTKNKTKRAEMTDVEMTKISAAYG